METTLQPLVSSLYHYASFSIPTLASFDAMIISLPAISCTFFVQCEAFVCVVKTCEDLQETQSCSSLSEMSYAGYAGCFPK